MDRCGASTHDPTAWDSITRIGNEHPDRLRTSGYLNNLSRCAVPIRMRGSYPDTRPRDHQPPGSRRLACGKSTGLTSSHGSHPSDAITRIGDEHSDRLRTSGYLNNLSGCAVPIRMRRSYPDAPFLSGCAVPIQMRGSYPDAPFLSRTTAGGLTPPIDGLPTPPRASSAPPQHTQPIRMRAAQA